MLNPEVWVTGGTTMAVGMGIVFSFLVILVFAMLIMANVVAWLNKVCPLPEVAVKTVKKVTSDDSAIAVAIAAVISKTKK